MQSHVEVVQRRQRNVQKIFLHLKSCCTSTLKLLFCRSRCRCRRMLLLLSLKAPYLPPQ